MNLPIQIQLNSLGVLASDVEEKFVRGSGPGGQKINKTSSTVWLRHRPTGIEVRIQRERSQAANRELAWAELCKKILAEARRAEAARRDVAERERRRKRQKSRAQKRNMVETKRHRQRRKSSRGRVCDD
jgi:protein subunit release factor B